MTIAVMSYSGSVVADEMDENIKRAETLFNEARAAVKANDYRTACPKFEESLKLARRAGTLFNLAQCEEHEGRLVSAVRYYKEGIVVLEPGDPRLAPSKKQLAIIEPRLPYLTIKLASSLPKGGRVTLDGREVEAIDVEFAVDPGKHEIKVLVPKYADEIAHITLDEGEHGTITVKAGPRLPDAPVTNALGPRRIAAIAAFGVGGLGFVTAAITGGLVVSANARMEEGCPQTVCTTAKGYEAARLGKTLLVVNTIAWGMTIAGAGAGTALLLLDKKKDATKPKSAHSLMIGPGFVGIEGSF
ncbi:MAG: PEGA domain-containing protein [Polyangiaceae bacterium]|nr:PEGA domain-containing protein [Polyangiaceae bacterium]